MSFTASLVELKAEVYKKKEESKKAPIKEVNLKEGGYKWKYLAEKLDHRRKIRQLTVKCEKAKSEDEKKKAEIELEKALRLSRESLERKAKIYEQKMDKAMQGFFQDSDEEPENEDEQCLVNFDEKALEQRKILNSKLKDPYKRTEPTVIQSDSDDEWVEFVDSLGRSRRCLKTELGHFIEADKNLKRSISPDEDSSSSKHTKDDDISKNFSTEEKILPPQGPIHYQNVRFNEIRDHGVGFFQFSEDAEERKKQMESLKSLREQTLKQREAKAKANEKKNQIVQQRLARIAARRGIKLKQGDQDKDISDEDKHDEENEDEGFKERDEKES